MSKPQTFPDPASAEPELLQFSSNRAPQWRTFSLRTLVEELCESLSPQLAAQAIETEIDVPDRQFVSADRDMLRWAVLNLMLNALDAMPNCGELVITSASTRYGVELEVGDSGEGLSDEVRSRAFEPFFTTKESKNGLGLTVASRIMEAHGGEVTALNCPEGGAAFTLRIPQVATRKAAA